MAMSIKRLQTKAKANDLRRRQFSKIATPIKEDIVAPEYMANITVDLSTTAKPPVSWLIHAGTQESTAHQLTIAG